MLDTGVSLSHPDLQGKVVVSKNFSSSSTVDDVNGHGSHVAGIAAAATNNAAGIAGLSFAQLTDTNGNGLRNDEVRSRIQSTADNVGLSCIGSGRINAYRAVTGASSTSPPANTSSPTISGSTVVGQRLRASAGAWTNSPTSYAYQ